ncbi:thiol reductant ABC exporter subunit CydD [Bermanella marisrubri]|nr:thiol reductant ABC exporter subunit CydD [Bermanella marisrubri]QIZ85622.1 thiol reductant ABC exporter subunit CydD [Bermanella marisrubri]
MRASILKTALFSVLSGIALILLFVLISRVVHGVLVDGWSDSTLEYLIPYFIAMIACIVFRGLTQYLQEHYATQSGLIIKRKVREQLIHSWHQSDLVELNNITAASRTNHFVEQVEALEGYFSRFLPQMKVAVWLPLIILSITFYLDWIAGIILLISAPLIPIFMAIVGMGAEAISQRHFASLERLSTQFLDKIKGMRALQAMGQVDFAKDRLNETSEQFRLLTMKTLKVAFLSSAVLEFFSAVAIAVLAMYIGFGLLGYINWGPSSELSLFSGLLILLLAPELFQPLRSLAQHYHDRASALGAAAQLLHASKGFTKKMPEKAEYFSASVKDENRLDVVDVSKTFDKRGDLFRHLSFTARKGEIIVLKGKSGTGKSTLLRLLAGFEAPDSGHINIFSQPPGTEPCAWLSQTPFTLFGSWRQNLDLLHSDRHAGIEENSMLAALEKVDLLDRVNMSDKGLDEVIGESAYGLSGGQAQRLALARTILSPFPLILLDEPTASLDKKSAEIVVNNLRTLAQHQRLVIVASHDESIIHEANQIIDLDDAS